MIWLTPVEKTTYHDANYLWIQTQGKAIKSPINTKVNRNMFIVRYYTWPDHMTKPSIVRGSDDWCFFRRDSTSISSSTINNVVHTSSTYPVHDIIQRSEIEYVN